MAWAPDYCSAEELREFVRIPGEDTLDAAQLTLAVAAASRAIDAATGRQFGQVEDPETRVFTARFEHSRRRWVVPIDDLMTTDGMAIVLASGGHPAASGVAVPGVSVVGDGVGTQTALNPSAFRPTNAAQHGRPWTELVIGSSTVQPIGDEAEVEVTALWGWRDVPAAVKQAALLQASRLFSRRDSPYGVAGSADTGSEVRLLARVDPDVEVALAGLRRRKGRGGAVFA